MAQSDVRLKTQQCDSVINKINCFLASPQYVVLAAFLSLVSNLFSLELPVYTVIAAIFVYTGLFGADLLPILPFFAFGYLTPSVNNNPGKNAASVFSGNSGVYILCLAGLMAAALLYRVIRDRKQFATKRYRLLLGLLALGAAYMLSGLGSKAYPAFITKNLVFAALQCCSLILPYLLFSGGVNWHNARRDYLAWIGFSAGGLLLCQILWIYPHNGVVVDGVIRREFIYTGWGIHNNLGGMLGMMIPFAFYLATKYRRGWIGTVVGSLFLVGVLLSCSRNAIIVSVVGYCVCIFLMLYYARNRRHNTFALVTVVGLMALSILIFHRPLLRLFSGLLSMGLNPSSRDVFFVKGLELFAQAPVFGSSFFSPAYVPWDWSVVDAFSGFFPPRWHNTILQLLASCGVVGVGAYLFHRFQTIRLLTKIPSKETVFIACSMGILLICSLFDCHFFNIGPALFYSAALAFGENCRQVQ